MDPAKEDGERPALPIMQTTQVPDLHDLSENLVYPQVVAMDNSKGCFICVYTCINIYIYIHIQYIYIIIYIYMSLNIIYKDKDVTPTNIPVTWPWRLPLPYWISTSQTWTSQLRSSARLIEMQLPLQSCTCSRPQHALPGAPTQTGFYQDPQFEVWSATGAT